VLAIDSSSPFHLPLISICEFFPFGTSVLARCHETAHDFYLFCS
jgi:hypothetical protein